ncbi:MAG: aminopeptidase P family protein [Firmicutes bacterium]|nr:aminopeptidase P family protein [Bacillota bacterium]
MTPINNIDRFWAHLETDGIATACLTERVTIRYLSGFAPSFYDDPAVLVISRLHPPVLIVPETLEGEAAQVASAKDIRTYQNYDPGDLVCKASNLADLVSRVLCDIAGEDGDLGVEGAHFPVRFAERLGREKPGVRLRDVSATIRKMRLVKTAEEIERIRRSAALADAGHAEVKRLMREGISEIEIFSLARARMEALAGKRIFVKADLVAGTRSEEIGGHPGTNRVRRGDLVIADLLPCLDDYWADTTSTTVSGEPAGLQPKMQEIVRDALQQGIESVRPGMPARELDQIVRSRIERNGYGYPHHTGHGVGLSDFEGPVIGRSSESVLEEGMVITVEPGIYGPGIGGLRLEDTMLITAKGAEVLSNHSKELV